LHRIGSVLDTARPRLVGALERDTGCGSVS
jgi:hypothetical protein